VKGPWGRTGLLAVQGGTGGLEASGPVELTLLIVRSASYLSTTGENCQAAAPGPCCPTGRAAPGPADRTTPAIRSQELEQASRPLPARRSGRGALRRRLGENARPLRQRLERNNSAPAASRPCRPPQSARCSHDSKQLDRNALRSKQQKTPGNWRRTWAQGITSDSQDQQQLLAVESEAAGQGEEA